MGLKREEPIRSDRRATKPPAGAATQRRTDGTADVEGAFIDITPPEFHPEESVRRRHLHGERRVDPIEFDSADLRLNERVDLEPEAETNQELATEPPDVEQSRDLAASLPGFEDLQRQSTDDQPHDENETYDEDEIYDEDEPHDQDEIYDEDEPHDQDEIYDEDEPYDDDQPQHENEPYDDHQPQDEDEPYDEDQPSNDVTELDEAEWQDSEADESRAADVDKQGTATGLFDPSGFELPHPSGPSPHTDNSYGFGSDSAPAETLEPRPINRYVRKMALPALAIPLVLVGLWWFVLRDGSNRVETTSAAITSSEANVPSIPPSGLSIGESSTPSTASAFLDRNRSATGNSTPSPSDSASDPTIASNPTTPQTSPSISTTQSSVAATNETKPTPRSSAAAPVQPNAVPSQSANASSGSSSSSSPTRSNTDSGSGSGSSTNGNATPPSGRTAGQPDRSPAPTTPSVTVTERETTPTQGSEPSPEASESDSPEQDQPESNESANDRAAPPADRPTPFGVSIGGAVPDRNDFVEVSARSGASVNAQGIRISVEVSGRQRSRQGLSQFALLNEAIEATGDNASIRVRVENLPAGTYRVVTWNYDPSVDGTVRIQYRVGGGDLVTIGDEHRLDDWSRVPFEVTNDGNSTTEILVTEASGGDGVLLNGFYITPT